MKTYISLHYLKLALRHGAAVKASPSRLVGGWLAVKPLMKGVEK